MASTFVFLKTPKRETCFLFYSSFQWQAIIFFGIMLSMRVNASELLFSMYLKKYLLLQSKFIYSLNHFHTLFEAKEDILQWWTILPQTKNSCHSEIGLILKTMIWTEEWNHHGNLNTVQKIFFHYNLTTLKSCNTNNCKL